MPKCCLMFSGGSTSNKNARCPFSRKQSNKNAQMCWLEWRYDMAVLYKLRFWNYGNQWKLLEFWKPMNAELWKSNLGCIWRVWVHEFAFAAAQWVLRILKHKMSQIQMCNKQRTTSKSLSNFSQNWQENVNFSSDLYGKYPRLITEMSFHVTACWSLSSCTSSSSPSCTPSSSRGGKPSLDGRSRTFSPASSSQASPR